MLSTKALLRESLAQLISLLGIDRATRALLWRDRVAVLVYHDPKPQVLDEHLSYLRSICDLVPLSAVQEPGNGVPRAAITLDDGNIGNADLLPVFIRHNVRPTIFLCSQFVAKPRKHWWLYSGATPAGVERLKRLTNAERLAELATAGYRQDEFNEASGLTLHQISEMRPYVDFQAHTRFHPILTRCDDKECYSEIADCKSELESLIGEKCEHFAFPNGNYTGRELSFIKAAGYMTARTCNLGWNSVHTDPYQLKAVIIDDDASLRLFAAQLTCIPVFLRYVRHGRNFSGKSPQF
ncbi:Polysaccharide deacetylase [Burkholderia sp. 8Y]|nr:Polysaccharide deacetylase [Burkholderia sp. 8Y]